MSAALRGALYLPVEQRVLRRLVEVAELYGLMDGTVVPIGQAALAALAGAARQTTNRVLVAA